MAEYDDIVAEAEAEAKRRAEDAKRAEEAQAAELEQRELLFALLSGDAGGDPAVESLLRWGSEVGVSFESLLAGESVRVKHEVSTLLDDFYFDGEVTGLEEFVSRVVQPLIETTPLGLGRGYAGGYANVLDATRANPSLFTADAVLASMGKAEAEMERQRQAQAEADELAGLLDSGDGATQAEAIMALVSDGAKRLQEIELPSFGVSEDRNQVLEAQEYARSAPATSTPGAGVRADTRRAEADRLRAESGAAAPRTAAVIRKELESARLIGTRNPEQARWRATRIQQLRDELEGTDAGRAAAAVAAGSNVAPGEMNPYTGGAGNEAAVEATDLKKALNEIARLEALIDDVDTPADVGDGTVGNAPRLSAAEQAEANQSEVEALLASQFGGFAFFLQKNKTELMVGLTADGMIVAADDPTAVSAKNVLDVIVEQGITEPTRVTGILQNTEWWKNTDAVMRQFDANYGEMSEPEKLEFLEPVLDGLRDEARFLGFEMSPDRARELAEKIAREGEAGDSEYIRGLMVLEGEFNSMETEMSDFAAARDQIEALSRSYYVPIGTEEAAQWAEDVYVGTKSATQVEQYFKEMAINKFPTLKNAIEGGLTADQYFAPYKYEIEKMLDRPNVDMYEEFGDVIEYMPDTGGETPRPMTLGEVRKYVRGLDEWQTSASGQDSARSLAFAIGKTFGEVA